jgi:N-acetylglucosamine-6-phosphate deacetylase
MIEIAGARVVLPDRVVGPATIVIEGERIVDVRDGASRSPSSPVDTRFHVPGHYVVPGFIDVHVHGVEGVDSLDGRGAIQRIARCLPRYGVTAFCPTSVACAPETLRALLADVRAARARPDEAAARVLPAHLESNFINPDYRGAQPLACLRSPRQARAHADFTGAEILAEIASVRREVGIVTLAPELDGAIDLIRELVAHGHRVSLGHSGATYEQAVAGIEAGARQATHLFNRMTPLGHRAPGLTGAALDRPEVDVEIICDGAHVHPAGIRLAHAAKGSSAILAITDGTAGSGLPAGARASLGGRPITVRDMAYLEDGTIAGSVLTMDRAFQVLVKSAGLGLIDAARMCASNPARALRLEGLGAIEAGGIADLVVLDGDFHVAHTFIAGRPVWPAPA